jgi:hypothetical protein
MSIGYYVVVSLKQGRGRSRPTDKRAMRILVST